MQIGKLSSNNIIECADFIKLINDWFDVFNAKVPEIDSRDRKKAYGLALNEQEKILHETDQLILKLKVPNRKCLLPFQKGILVNNQSLRLLYKYLKEKYNFTYILTNRLNQDVLENFFSHIRSKGGLNDHPTALQFKYRLRSYLLDSLSSSLTSGKRNRFLIRQPRIKRDSDIGSQQSPDIVEFDPMSSHSSLLTVPPPKIERHASEPAPSTESKSPYLLSVPQSTPFLMKQHSHPLLPSQSPPSIGSVGSFTLHRQLSHPIPSSSTITISAEQPILSSSSSSCVLTTGTLTQSTTTGGGGIVHFVTSSIKQEPTACTKSEGQSPSVILVSDPLTTPPLPPTIATSLEHVPTIRVKTEELHRSASSPQSSIREISLENPRSSHCPVIRPGPALGCNFCWNTIDAHGRILRRKTKYHCPECQTNLCIVPCFQEYHERQSSDNPSNESTNPLGTTRSKSLTSTSSIAHYPKTGSM